jgi:hypothetical protein
MPPELSLTTSSWPKYLKGLISRHNHSLRCWVRTSIFNNFGESQFSPKELPYVIKLSILIYGDYSVRPKCYHQCLYKKLGLGEGLQWYSTYLASAKP